MGIPTVDWADRENLQRKWFLEELISKEESREEFCSERNMCRAQGVALTPMDLLPGGRLLLTPFVPLFEPIRPTISSEMEVDIKLVRNDTLKLTNRETNQLGCNRESKMAIPNTCDMKNSRGSTKNSMQSKTGWSFREMKCVTPKNSKQMKSTTGRRRRMVNRRPTSQMDDSFKVFTPLEVPIFYQSSELIILLELQEVPQDFKHGHRAWLQQGQLQKGMP
jgi:hypothetical protein